MSTEVLTQPLVPPSAPEVSTPAAVAPPTVAAPSAADVTTPTAKPTGAPEAPPVNKGTDADVDAKAAYEKELDDYLAGRLNQEPPPPVVDKTPPAVPPDPQAATPPADPAPPEEPEDALPADGSLPKRMKVPVTSAFDLEFNLLRKRGYNHVDAMDAAAKRYPEHDEAKAWQAARQAPAQPNPKADVPGAPPPPAPSGDPATAAEAEAALEAAEDKLDKATMALDEDAMAEARKEMRRLNKLLPQLQQQEREQATAEAQSFEAVWNESLAEVEADYPAAADPQSPLSQRAAAIQKQWKESGNPLYREPQSPLILYRQAAKELGVARASAPAPAAPSPTNPQQPLASAPAPTSPVHRRPPASHMIASGPARTTQPGPTPEKRIEDMNKQELEQYTAEVLAHRAA